MVLSSLKKFNAAFQLNRHNFFPVLCLSVSLSVCTPSPLDCSVYLFLSMAVCVYISVYIFLSLAVSLYISVYLFLSLSVCLYISVYLFPPGAVYQFICVPTISTYFCQPLPASLSICLSVFYFSLSLSLSPPVCLPPPPPPPLLTLSSYKTSHTLMPEMQNFN